MRIKTMVLAGVLAVQAGSSPYGAVSGYLVMEDAGPADGTGLGIKGWGSVADNIFLNGEFQTADLDGTDVDQLRFGGGYWMPLNQPGLSVFGRGELIQIEIGRFDESGWGLHGGGMLQINPQLSAHASLGLLDVGDEDGFEFLLGGTYMVSPELGGFIEYRDFGGDFVDLTDIRIGATYYFSR